MSKPYKRQRDKTMSERYKKLIERLKNAQSEAGELTGTITDLRRLADHFYETGQNQAADLVRGAAEIISALQRNKGNARL